MRLELEKNLFMEFWIVCIFPRAFETVIFAKFGGQTECIQLGPLSYVNTSCQIYS